MTLQTEIRQVLDELGLTKPEIQVYLAALERGPASSSELAEAVGMNRVTTYEVLKRLSRKGFVKIRAKKNQRGRYFVPAEYGEIVERIKAKQTDLEHHLQQMKLLKNEFQSQFVRAEAKPVTLFYEGKEGIKAVLRDTLCSGAKEIVSFASAESLEEGFESTFLESYWQQRVSLGILTRGIIPKTNQAVERFNAERNRQELRDLRFLTPEQYHFANEIDIYDDTVGIISLSQENEHGIIIRSRSIAESFRAVFEALWLMSVK